MTGESDVFCVASTSTKKSRDPGGMSALRFRKDQADIRDLHGALNVLSAAAAIAQKTNPPRRSACDHAIKASTDAILVKPAMTVLPVDTG